MALFSACRMKTFARLISDELGVKVVLKGKEILARDGHPPTIYLPAMEYASEEAIKAVTGFALHEAGHVRYSDFRACKEMRSFAEKELHNAIEDEWVEHKLEKVFPGAREMLLAAHREGLEIVHGQPESIREESWLSSDSKLEILEQFKNAAKAEFMCRNPSANEADAGKAAEEAATLLTDERIEQVAKRLELRRAALCWLYRKRGYDKFVKLPSDWDLHPWKKVFDEETATRAKDSWQALDQARAILKRLGIQDALPGDERRSEELQDLAEKAKAARQVFKDARHKLREARANIENAVRQQVETSSENAAFNDAQRAHKAARKNHDRMERKATRAAERTKMARERLDQTTKRLDALKERLEASKDEAEQAALQERIGRLEGVVSRRHERFMERRRRDEAAELERKMALGGLEEAEKRLQEAKTNLENVEAAARNDAMAEHGKELEKLEQEHEDAKKNSDEALDAWKKLALEIKARDADIEAPIQPGVREEVVRRAWERHRGQGVGEDVELLTPEDAREVRGKHGLPEFDGSARTYTVFDRSKDTVEKVRPTPQADADHKIALREQAALIDELVASLKRLHSPVQSRVNVNVERGRLDAKRLFRVGLALRGAPVDARKVWKTITTKPDPKVAVSLLLDCSGSMTKHEEGQPSRIKVAIRAAAALSAAMRELNIPHEILGHTTHLVNERKTPEPDLENFSRFAPFRGFTFKLFEENAEPCCLFSQFDMMENLDGEAVLWAARRLEARPEKTRVLIVVSDGLPSATHSNTGELERHLLTVCRTLEAQEEQGMHLHAIGIGEERVKSFYRNAEVIDDVSELPKAVMNVVERTMLGVGTMA